MDSRPLTTYNDAPPPPASEDISPAVNLLVKINEEAMNLALQTIELSVRRGLSPNTVCTEAMAGGATELVQSKETRALLSALVPVVRSSQITLGEYILRVVRGISLDILCDFVFAAYAPGISDENHQLLDRLHRKIIKTGLYPS